MKLSTLLMFLWRTEIIVMVHSGTRQLGHKVLINCKGSLPFAGRGRASHGMLLNGVACHGGRAPKGKPIDDGSLV